MGQPEAVSIVFWPVHGPWFQLGQAFYAWYNAPDRMNQAPSGVLPKNGLSHEPAMPNNVYSEINLHLTWHTKGSAPLIHDAVEHHLYQFLEQRVKQTPGAVCHAVGGTDDHVHLAVSIPPTVQVSDWVGRLKGAGAHYLNQRVLNKKRFAWQAGYGVVSFGSKDLPWVGDYIKRQRDHHATGHTHGRLERIEADAQS